MAGEYFDAGFFKKTRNGKNFWVKCGSAKMRDDGGFDCYLDAYPTAGEYGVVLTIKPQRERDGFGGGSQQAASGQNRPTASDDVPW